MCFDRLFEILVLYKVLDLADWWSQVHTPQIREQMLVPDLYVFTLKFEIPKQPIKMD